MSVSYIQRLKAREKKHVFRDDLKINMVGEALILKGRLFQSIGAAASKARSPLVLNLVVRSSSNGQPTVGVWGDSERAAGV